MRSRSSRAVAPPRSFQARARFEFGRQLRKYGRDVEAVVRAQVRRDGSGRDLGYPGGRHRPPRFEEEWAAQRIREERRS